MSEHRATISWARSSDGFSYAEYNRDHEWTMGSGQRLPASAAPAYGGNGQCTDPEEAFVASIASCHMLTFLAICARKRIIVDRYEDSAVGTLAKNAAGRLAVTRVALHPQIRFAAERPADKVLQGLHDRSHHECFIANSVTTEIILERLA
jgi:organic hydroperoxide reductase OsmC/OhrA